MSNDVLLQNATTWANHSIILHRVLLALLGPVGDVEVFIQQTQDIFGLLS